MAARTISAELRDAMKQLRLGQLLTTLPERITLAEKESLPIEDFLLGLFTDEVERRHSAAASRRADDAGLDPDMVFERWDKTAKVTFDRRVLQELSSQRSQRRTATSSSSAPWSSTASRTAHASSPASTRTGLRLRLRS
jgi:hypothetical protein